MYSHQHKFLNLFGEREVEVVVGEVSDERIPSGLHQFEKRIIMTRVYAWIEVSEPL